MSLVVIMMYHLRMYLKARMACVHVDSNQISKIMHLCMKWMLPKTKKNVYLLLDNISSAFVLSLISLINYAAMGVQFSFSFPVGNGFHYFLLNVKYRSEKNRFWEKYRYSILNIDISTAKFRYFPYSIIDIASLVSITNRKIFIHIPGGDVCHFQPQMSKNVHKKFIKSN